MMARCFTLLLAVGALAPVVHAQTTAELWESEQTPERLETNELIERALAMGKIQDLSERPYRLVRLVDVPITGECVDITHPSATA